MSGIIVRRFSRCVCDRIRSFRSLSSDPIGFRRYTARRRNGDKDDDEEEERKRRTQRFFHGEVLPSIFEGISNRKPAGKNDQGLCDQQPPDLTDGSGGIE